MVSLPLLASLLYIFPPRNLDSFATFVSSICDIVSSNSEHISSSEHILFTLRQVRVTGCTSSFLSFIWIFVDVYYYRAGVGTHVDTRGDCAEIPLQ